MENLDNPIEEVKEEIVEAPVAEVVIEEPAHEEPKPVQEVIGAHSLAPSVAEEQGVGVVTDGAIGVALSPKPVKKAAAKKAAPAKEKVAVHSTKNVTWSGVGKVYTGYNIVDADAAEKWLTRSHIRKATPEEVAKEFGK